MKVELTPYFEWESRRFMELKIRSSIMHRSQASSQVSHSRIGMILCLLAVSCLTCGSARAQRVAIVYSESSAAKYYDPFVYNQLFMSVQNHARMAGIPYDFLTEDDLTDVNKLLTYQTLIIPAMPNVKVAKLAAIEFAIDQAVLDHHVGIIACGDLMNYSETGAWIGGSDARVSRWFGVVPGNYLSGVATTMVAQTTTHPTMRDYAANEVLFSWPKFWFRNYTPMVGRSATVLSALKSGTAVYSAAVANEGGGHRVHFSNERVMGCTNQLWSCIQWTVYGNQPPVQLSLGRMKSLFTARNDMDQSMYNAQLSTTEIPLYQMLADWKASYNFVGSYYINVGNKRVAGQFTDWSVSGPLYQNYIALGNEIGTHSYTHPVATSLLDATQLEFEFNQSKDVIGTQLGITVAGAAIPGQAESIAVQNQLDNYFSHVSGRYGAPDNGFP